MSNLDGIGWHIFGVPVRLVERTKNPDGMDPIIGDDGRVVRWLMTEAAAVAMFGRRPVERYKEMSGEGTPQEPSHDDIGTFATCRDCGKRIQFIGPYWSHVPIEGPQPRHPALPMEFGRKPAAPPCNPAPMKTMHEFVNVEQMRKAEADRDRLASVVEEQVRTITALDAERDRLMRRLEVFRSVASDIIAWSDEARRTGNAFTPIVIVERLREAVGTDDGNTETCPGRAAIVIDWHSVSLLVRGMTVDCGDAYLIPGDGIMEECRSVAGGVLLQPDGSILRVEDDPPQIAPADVWEGTNGRQAYVTMVEHNMQGPTKITARIISDGNDAQHAYWEGEFRRQFPYLMSRADNGPWGGADEETREEAGPCAEVEGARRIINDPDNPITGHLPGACVLEGSALQEEGDLADLEDDDGPEDVQLAEGQHPTAEEVCNALLLTDRLPMAKAIAAWTQDQLDTAYEWAMAEHLGASDNPVKRKPLPPHVDELPVHRFGEEPPSDPSDDPEIRRLLDEITDPTLRAVAEADLRARAEGRGDGR